MRYTKELLAEIERKYVFGIRRNGKVRYPSLRELSIEYDIPYETLKVYSSKGGWSSKRNANLGLATAEDLLETSENVKEAFENGQDVDEIEQAANLGIGACVELLKQLQQMAKTDSNTRTNAQLARTLSEALKNFATVKTGINKPQESQKGDMKYVVEFSGLAEDSKADN